MAKAHLTTKSGTTIVVEGTPDEVAAVMRQLEAGPSVEEQRPKRRTKEKSGTTRDRPTPQNLISSLIDGGFFKKPKDLGAVKAALEEMGHHYPVTTLSPVLLRLVRKRELRRLRDQKRWVYTGG